MSELDALVSSLSMVPSISATALLPRSTDMIESETRPVSFLQQDYPVHFEVVPVDFEEVCEADSTMLKDSKCLASFSLTDMEAEEFTGIESYENSYTRHFDKAFYKFEKEVAKHPWQLVRYCWRGRPLLPVPVTSAESFDVPLCSSCGAKQVFEFQLMSTILASLSVDDPKYLGHLPCQMAPSRPFDTLGMDWISILVYSCERDCLAYQTLELHNSHAIIIKE